MNNAPKLPPRQTQTAGQWFESIAEFLPAPEVAALSPVLFALWERGMIPERAAFVLRAMGAQPVASLAETLYADKEIAEALRIYA